MAARRERARALEVRAGREDPIDMRRAMKLVWLCGVLLAMLLSSIAVTPAMDVVKNLTVEYRATPLGIDVTQPRFGWQMEAAPAARGVYQTAYRIEVRDPKGNLVWDSKRVESREALAIAYQGAPLSGATRYTWTVTAWNQAGTPLSATSWFETGLMDPAPGSAAWSGAKWIGGGDEDLVLYAPYQAIFDASYAITIAPGSTRASFVFGANDSRLMDRFKNVYQIESPRDRSYIKLELDVSALDGAPDGTAKVHVYRAGYAPADAPSKPFRTFDIPTSVIDAASRNREHAIAFHDQFGQVTLTVDGSSALKPLAEPGSGPTPGRRQTPNAVNLNPMGDSWDYLPFGLLCDIGFSVEPGQRASFRDVTIRNSRSPGHALFEENVSGASYNGIFADAIGPGLSVDNGRFDVDGGASGVFIARDPSRNSAPMLRTSFKTSGKPIAAARLYVTARGIYEVYLNGSRVGDDYYNPGLSQYNLTHFYQTYDVTSLVRSGDNAIGAVLSEGWWSGLLSFGAIWNHFGDRQSLLAKLVVTYADGTSDVVATNDHTWKLYTHGPVVYGSLDFGEVYDTAREAAVNGWATPAFDDRAWKPAFEVPLTGTTFAAEDVPFGGGARTTIAFDKLSLVGQIGDTARVFRTLPAKSAKQVRPGVFVYDLGQNIVGVPRITFANGRAGARITLRYAEMLYPDLPESGKNVGMIMTENYRAALSQDVYTMKAGRQVYQPRFTSHGFQYIEITGIDRPLPISDVEGVAISSVHTLTADYRTSNEKVNRLWSNLVWSNVDNFLTLPTDCPQRNERMGWSGDINVFSRTATYLSNADQFLTRHMYAMRDVQAPTGRFTDVAPVGGGFGGVLWGSAGIVVPWEVYLQYKDAALLERHYPAMAAYANYLETTIDPKTGLSSDGTLGDWLGPQNSLLGSPFLVTAYHAYDLAIMAKVAAILDKPADAVTFQALADKRKAFFNATFVNDDGKTIATGRSGFGPGPTAAGGSSFRLADTQTSYAVGLGLGVFSPANIPSAVTHLADAVARENTDDDGVKRPAYSLMTGFIGTSWISTALSQNGLSAAAYRQLQNESYPSWLYAVDQGATTIWERLNGYTIEKGFGGNNSMNSFNHYSFGAVGQWMIAHSLGIERDEPGFQRFILQPEPDSTGAMTSAEGYYDSMYGRIESSWKVDGGVLTYRTTVPANTTATLYLPASSPSVVKEGGSDASRARGVTFVRQERGKAIYTLTSGTYEFTVGR
jgi:alpha-L-rhamnosidase